MKRILAIGAHPDDFELGCGGSLLKHKSDGDLTYGLILTNGKKGKHCPQGSECKASAKILGLEEVTQLDFMDTELPSDGKVIDIIRSFIKKYEPDIIYAHNHKDDHQDHRSAAYAVQSAAKHGVSRILLFESPSTLVEFAPHYYKDITPFYNGKIMAIKAYQSQLQRENSILDVDWIETRSRYWGFKIKPRSEKGKKHYAEAFEINHIIDY
jgi:LmbE family N-acetylglucosaminyl deacetylase